MSDEDFKKLLEAVPAHPGKIQWVQDKYGTTSEIKKAGIAMAGKIKGDPERMKTALRTLAIISQHIKARMKADQEHQKARMERLREAEKSRIAVQSFGLEAKTEV